MGTIFHTGIVLRKGNRLNTHTGGVGEPRDTCVNVGPTKRVLAHYSQNISNFSRIIVIGFLILFISNAFDIFISNDGITACCMT